MDIVHGSEKIFNQLESTQKNSCTQWLMSNTCTLILVGVATPVSNILLLSIIAKFPFIVNGQQKIQLFGISSKKSCK